MIPTLRGLLTGEASGPLTQLLRYAVVGGVAFAVDLGVLAGLHYVCGVYYLTAAAIAFVFGLATNYVLSVLWVFDQRVYSSPLVEFGLFALLGVMGLGLTELMLFLLTGLAGVPLLVSKAVATAVTFAWNFVSRKLLLFTPEKGGEGAGLAPALAPQTNPGK